MQRTEIRLDTLTEVQKFVNICSQLKGKIELEDGGGYKVNARSLIGALYSTEWTHLYCISEYDIYSYIKDFAID